MEVSNRFGQQRSQQQKEAFGDLAQIIRLLQYCQKNGITVIAYSPLATGLGNIRAADPEGALRRVTEASCKSEAQVAMNWCIRRENVIAIPKAPTVTHFIKNAGASGWVLQPELARLLEDRIRYRRRGALQINARRAVRRGMQMIGHWQARTPD
jgi:diketogulonate reductase-like aldo/keto reductase